MLDVQDTLPLELFDAVQSLVIVDASDPYTTFRWFRGWIAPLELDTPDDDAYLWEGWWEHVKELIEEEASESTSPPPLPKD